MLDHIDALTRMMAAALAAGDHDLLDELLDESIAVEKRLAESREATWSVWFAPHQAEINRRIGRVK